MYKILTKGIATNGLVNWSFYEEFTQEFATQSIIEASEKYRELLNSFSINNLKLVDDINLEITVANIEDEAVIVPITSAILVNDGINFNIKLTNNEDKYMWIDYNQEAFDKIVEKLTLLGLTDVTIDVQSGITSLNPTTLPITTTNIVIPETLFVAYNNVDKTTNNESGEYLIVIE